MLRISKDRILEKLNDYSRDALKRASELCIEQSGYEITTGHYLIALLEQPAGDVSRILSSINVSGERLEALLRKSFEKIKRGSTELPQFSPMLLELLQDALVLASGELDEDEIRTGTILIALAQNPDRYCHFYLFAEFEQMDDQAMLKGFRELTKGSMEGPVEEDNSSSAAGGKAMIESETALSKFCRNVTAQASEGLIDPVFCRDEEIGMMEDILCRRRKNNPILVGEPGVGKTALAEGLALKIIAGDVPNTLKGAVLWELDMGALQAGASVKGEFERRLKGVLDEILNAAEKIVLFIDEAHTLIGGGGQAGGSDAANLLKPALARGQIRAIAATTWSEYKKYFEKDPALARRFQLIKLEEPTPDEAVTILRGLRGAYEDLHKVFITDAALEAASVLSARYLTGRQLPDKALDVLDTACVRVAAEQTAQPRTLEILNQQIRMLEQECIDRDRETLMQAEGAEPDQHALKQRLKALNAKADELRAQWENELALACEVMALRETLREETGKDETDDTIIQDIRAQISTRAQELTEISEVTGRLVNFEVGTGTVAKVVSDWTGVPPSSVSDDDATRVIELGNRLKEVVRGQDGALDIIHDRMKAARLDLIRETVPRGVFLLVGSSGVGKTETAEQLALHLYGGRQFLTTINMSEYQEKHTVSRLIGSPPGYVGFGEGGVLTEAIRKKPYSVVLLDEVEKAHPDVMNLFYQAFDKGVLNDGEGREIDCKNIVFFMTSNLGSEALTQNPDTVETASLDALERALRPHLEHHFKPALLARMRILCFKPLAEETVASIIDLKLQEQANLLRKNRRLELSWDDDVRQLIASLSAHSENGARMVSQMIERWILPPIADEALDRIAQRLPFSEVQVSARDGGFELTFLPESIPESADVEVN